MVVWVEDDARSLGAGGWARPAGTTTLTPEGSTRAGAAGGSGRGGGSAGGTSSCGAGGSGGGSGSGTSGSAGGGWVGVGVAAGGWALHRAGLDDGTAADDGSSRNNVAAHGAVDGDTDTGVAGAVATWESDASWEGSGSTSDGHLV